MSADSFNLENSLTYKLHSLAKLIDRHADYTDLEPVRISSAEGRVLAVIGFNKVLSVVQVAKKANLDKSQGSRAVVSLVDKGLIEKRQQKQDARAFDLSLTEKGKQVYEEVVALIMHRNDIAMKTLSAEEQQNLLNLINKIQHNLENN
ncbi:MarR family transcriptional regulator [Advenella alkanexedens]|jgi:DNA-binding MarR family transcriptional regulator|uniref:MarR family transcriptional regulator n=1 Tax=Advenella alkanexedens TaxID=1481665 RepID=A0ABS6NK30_9BURK|nr:MULTISPECIES: MarR family transcriptional regulator [Advenella]MBV4395977.1 MarR family transcriptional regulator [Advenella alkanexedens]MDD3757227.1 MarR family transcriptional regulator [Advenella sp.]NLN67658.1 MarR family transcriptional regulator [Alcaligenaceae bacterium]